MVEFLYYIRNILLSFLYLWVFVLEGGIGLQLRFNLRSPLIFKFADLAVHFSDHFKQFGLQLLVDTHHAFNRVTVAILPLLVHQWRVAAVHWYISDRPLRVLLLKYSCWRWLVTYLLLLRWLHWPPFIQFAGSRGRFLLLLLLLLRWCSLLFLLLNWLMLLNYLLRLLLGSTFWFWFNNGFNRHLVSLATCPFDYWTLILFFLLVLVIVLIVFLVFPEAFIIVVIGECWLLHWWLRDFFLYYFSWLWFWGRLVCEELLVIIEIVFYLLFFIFIVEISEFIFRVRWGGNLFLDFLLHWTLTLSSC